MCHSLLFVCLLCGTAVSVYVYLRPVLCARGAGALTLLAAWECCICIHVSAGV